jgi:2-haloacid dehalogenase
MSDDPLASVTTLTFDVFGTVLDLTGSMTPPIREFLKAKSAKASAEAFWAEWRSRQRIEQYQDNLMMLGHSGYLETCRKALVYCLRANGIEFAESEVRDVMQAWRGLSPHPDCAEGLRRLKSRYKLVALSNGEQHYLEQLERERMRFGFDRLISVQAAGVFKPHPAVYRTAATILGLEPHRIMMVAAHGFDIMGARACGYRGAYVNRYRLPADESPYRPDIEVRDFAELAGALGSSIAGSMAWNAVVAAGRTRLGIGAWLSVTLPDNLSMRRTSPSTCSGLAGSKGSGMWPWPLSSCKGGCWPSAGAASASAATRIVVRIMAREGCG